jgi:hypothetical protein
MISERLQDGWKADKIDHRKPGGQIKFSLLPSQPNLRANNMRRIRKPMDITHGGIKITMDEENWKTPFSDLRLIPGAVFYQEMIII